jgi:hypothetical protein
MRYAIYALLLTLPINLPAQTANGQPPQIPEFADVKMRMLPMMTDSLGPMTQTRDCIAASQNSDQLNGCISIMADYQKKMMASMDRGHATPPPEPPKLEWSEELKTRMLTDIDLSIKNTLSTKSCLELSTSHEQMTQCMEAAGLTRKPAKQ